MRVNSWIRLRRLLFFAVTANILTWSHAAHAASLTLAWDANREPDIAGYVLYWGTQSGAYGSSVNVGNNTEHQVDGLANNTRYYFVVKAYNTAGIFSGPSTEVSGMTSGSTPGGCSTPPIPVSCSIGTDFNGDGTPDLIWQQDSTRQVVVWNMGGAQGNTFLGWTWLSQSEIPGWRVAAVRDFNGDGKHDLVWQNESTRQILVWNMGGSQGNQMVGSVWLSQSGTPGWTVVGARDFNGDGKIDLVFQNDVSRQVVVWYLGGVSGEAFLGWASLASDNLPGWTLVATSDFDRDGKIDLAWQNDATRDVVVWYMGGGQGATFLRWTLVTTGASAGYWRLAGTSDPNRDGSVDLVWQNDWNRQVVVWYLGGAQGTQSFGSNWLSGDVPGWTVVAR
jgi:hypothetical protein